MPKDHNGQSFEHRARYFDGIEPSASVDFDWDAVEGKEPDAEGYESSVRIIAAMMRAMISDIFAAKKLAEREAEFHALAIGLMEDGEMSMRSTAKRWGISPEAVSKSVEAIRVKHRLSLNIFNKPAAVAEGYRETNQTRRKL